MTKEILMIGPFNSQLLFTFICAGILIVFNNCGEFESADLSSELNLSQSTDQERILKLSQTHFEEKIVVHFKQKCASCHENSLYVTGVPAPLTIYDFKKMKAMLNINPLLQADSSFLYRYVSESTLGHPGGNQCPEGNNSTTCRLIYEWWSVDVSGEVVSPRQTGGPDPIESNGDSTPNISDSSDSIEAGLQSISTVGLVEGFVYSNSQPSKTFKVIVYLDGPVGLGSLLDSYSANQPGPGGKFFNHYFAIQIPAYLFNGTPRDVYVYASSAAPENLISGSPKAWRAYTPSDAGRSYYNNNVKPFFLSNCASCHSAPGKLDYDNKFLPLSMPFPDLTGTPTNNDLFNRMRGYTGHKKFCTSDTSTPCKELQELWSIEFEK